MTHTQQAEKNEAKQITDQVIAIGDEQSPKTSIELDMVNIWNAIALAMIETVAESEFSWYTFDMSNDELLFNSYAFEITKDIYGDARWSQGVIVNPMASNFDELTHELSFGQKFYQLIDSISVDRLNA